MHSSNPRGYFSSLAWPILLLALGQSVLFFNFINREMAWDYILHGDPTWYVFFNYKIFNAVIERNWVTLWQHAAESAWGELLFYEATICQLLLGPSRASVSFINLVYYLAAQLATYAFFARYSRSRLGGLAAVLLLMTMMSPFRSDGPGLNIADFHFDLVLFFMLLFLHYLVSWSGLFRDRRWAIWIGVFAALIVATRLVSFFLIATVMGSYGLLLAWRALNGAARLESRRILMNYLLGAGAFLVGSAIPLWIARGALYHHYFRFLFDAKFAADTAGLYVMGTSSKAEEAYQLLARMFKFDFGVTFLVATVIVLALASLLRARFDGRVAARSPVQSTGQGESRTETREMDSRRLDREFLIFVGLSAVSSYLLHLFFPIKSDHLTRMTAAPLFIALALLAARTIAHGGRIEGQVRRISIGAVTLLACTAIYTQCSFYFGVGRHHDTKEEMLKVDELYGDISAIARQRKIRDVAISVDRVVGGGFELGALMSYFTYEYEKHGIIREPAPMLGQNWDQPIAAEDAMRKVQQSDFVMLGSLPYEVPMTPLNKSLRAVIPEIHEYVKANFCMYRKYMIFGQERSLYVRPLGLSWQYAASSSIESRYGPERLVEGGGNIWHAKWQAGNEQWVTFSNVQPIHLAGFSIVPQTGGGEDRAPRDFRLQARGTDGEWVDLLSVKDASFADGKPRSWTLADNRKYSQYRLVVTKNNGHPTLMTIMRIDLDITDKPEPCNGVR